MLSWVPAKRPTANECLRHCYFGGHMEVQRSGSQAENSVPSYQMAKNSSNTGLDLSLNGSSINQQVGLNVPASLSNSNA